ncbi:KOW domain-containing RNA-binding protein [Paenibacillus periandrae]|uniref:KOW domain-containing RNA-binding protein n=1 Tax=Paenibacillus periandrae TaxID=1761741 RepID=UPI001F089835
MNLVNRPQLGQLVRIIRGNDSGKYAVIINVEDQRFVWIVDGDKRRFDQPKKKNILHLELLPIVSSEVVDSMSDSGRVTNSKLRFVINKVVNQILSEAQEKGE